jgi:hypothetical protein
MLSPTKSSSHAYTTSSSLTADVEDYVVDDTTNYIIADLINRYKTIDTMVPDIDKYYVTCFEGKVNVVAFKFIQDAVCGYALIIQGIYPISNDFQGKIGSTERHILQYLKSEYFPVGKISWNDVCPYSSKTTNSVMKQSKIKKLIEIDEVIQDNYYRLDQHLKCTGTDRIPCVFLAGDTCRWAFRRACDMGIVTDKISLAKQYDVWRCRINGIICLVLDGRNHPSAHLMAGQSGTANEEFIETIFILNAMGRCTFEAAKSGHDDITPEMFQICLKIELDELEEESMMRLEGRKLMTELLYGNPSGIFPGNHRMLRHMAGHKEEVRMQVIEWKKLGYKVLFSILLHGYIYLNPLDYVEQVEYWRKEFDNDEMFAKFMSSGVASFLNDEPVIGVMVYMREELDNDEIFVKSLSNGFAKAISDPNRAVDFLTDVDDILDQIDDDHHQIIQQLRTLTTSPRNPRIDAECERNENLPTERSRKLDEVCTNWSSYDAEWEINLAKVKEWKADQIVSMLSMVHPHLCCDLTESMLLPIVIVGTEYVV